MNIILLSGIISLIGILFIPDIYSQNTEWKIYTDSEKGFTIDYSSEWKVELKENRFDSGDVDFIKKELTILGDGTLIEENTAIVAIVFGKHLGKDKIDPKDFANALSKRNQFTFNQYREIENNIDKYIVDGNPTYGFIATHYDNTGLSEQAQLQLVSFLDGKLFGVLYMTKKEDFYKYLPIVEQMIHSIKLK